MRPRAGTRGTFLIRMIICGNLYSHNRSHRPRECCRPLDARSHLSTTAMGALLESGPHGRVWLLCG
jgi:hypothetical protein